MGCLPRGFPVRAVQYLYLYFITCVSRWMCAAARLTAQAPSPQISLLTISALLQNQLAFVLFFTPGHTTVSTQHRSHIPPNPSEGPVEFFGVGSRDRGGVELVFMKSLVRRYTSTYTRTHTYHLQHSARVWLPASGFPREGGQIPARIHIIHSVASRAGRRP